VSHHPPITAAHCENDNWTFWGNTACKYAFWGKSFDVKPIGASHLILKKTQDHFVFYKNKTTVENILIGTMYIDHYDDITVKNHKTGETCVLTLKKKSWTEKLPHISKGFVKIITFFYREY